MLHELGVRTGVIVHNFARDVDDGIGTRGSFSSNSYLFGLREQPVPVEAGIVAEQLDRPLEFLPALTQTLPQRFALSQFLRTPEDLFIGLPPSPIALNRQRLDWGVEESPKTNISEGQLMGHVGPPELHRLSNHHHA